jgi:hypothetical protein
MPAATQKVVDRTGSDERLHRRLHLGQLGLNLRQRVVAAGVLRSPLSLDRFV